MANYIDANVLAGLANDVGQENLVLIADMYCNDAQGRVDLINAAIQEDDVEALSSQCHALKGGSLSVGASTLGNIMATAEAAAKAGDVATAKNALIGFETVFDETVKQLKAQL